MKKLTLLALFGMLWSSNPAFAAIANLGLLVGANRTTYSFGGNSPVGYGATGGLLASFLSSWPVGVRFSIFENYLNAKDGAVKVSGSAPLVAATIDANYSIPSVRASLGVGMGIEDQHGLSCEGSPSCPAFATSVDGLVLEAKFDAKDKFFGVAQYFFPLGESRRKLEMGQVIIGIGYQFGELVK